MPLGAELAKQNGGKSFMKHRNSEDKPPPVLWNFRPEMRTSLLNLISSRRRGIVHDPTNESL